MFHLGSRSYFILFNILISKLKRLIDLIAIIVKIENIFISFKTKNIIQISVIGN